MSLARVIVTLHDSSPAGLDHATEALKREGLTVERVLGAVGIVCGSVDLACIPRLQSMAEVAAVEEEREVRTSVR